MSFLFIGDPHIKQDNLSEVELLKERLDSVIVERKPDYIVIGGDILHYHEKLYTPSLNSAFDLVKRCSRNIPTYVLVGNHDLVNNQQFLTAQHWMNAMKEWVNVFIVDTTTSLRVDEKLFVFCPYVPPGRFEEALDRVPDWRDSCVIFAHQEIKGCKMGAIVSEHGDDWNDTLPLIISGHIHDNQKVGDRVYYPGSAMQHSFGDSDKNVIVMITADGCLEDIDLHLPKKRIINLSISDVKEYTPRQNEKVRVNISATSQEIKTFKKTIEYKSLVETGVKVHFKLRNEDDPLIETIEESGVEKFNELLLASLDEKNPFLMSLYEKVVNNREISCKNK